MGVSTHEELVRAALEWVSDRARYTGAMNTRVVGTTDLVGAGVLDSLGLIDLIAFVEEQSGGQIDLLLLDETQIATIDGLCRAALSAA